MQFWWCLPWINCTLESITYMKCWNGQLEWKRVHVMQVIEYAQKMKNPSKNTLFHLKLRWITLKDQSERNRVGEEIIQLLTEDSSRELWWPMVAQILQCNSCRTEAYYLCQYCDRCPTCCVCSSDTNPDHTLPGWLTLPPVWILICPSPVRLGTYNPSRQLIAFSSWFDSSIVFLCRFVTFYCMFY